MFVSPIGCISQRSRWVAGGGGVGCDTCAFVTSRSELLRDAGALVKNAGWDTCAFVTSRSDLLRDAGALVKNAGWDRETRHPTRANGYNPVHLFKRTIYSIIYIKYSYITRNE